MEQGKLELEEQTGCGVAAGLTPLVVSVLGLASVEERASGDTPWISSVERWTPNLVNQITTCDYLDQINLVAVGNCLQSLADARMVVVDWTKIAELLPVH